MSLDDVLEELIQVLETGDSSTLFWEEVRHWPDGAIEVLQKAGWIEAASPAKMVVCPGCEENCFMPVHVLSKQSGNPFRAFVACDRRDDIGRVPIAPEHLQQWQISHKQVAKWISGELGLKGKPQWDKTTRNFRLGEVQGKKRSGQVELVFTVPASLRISGHLISFGEVVYFENNQLQVDRVVIIKIADRTPVSDRYKSSNARREVRKLDTQARHSDWNKAYLDIKRRNPEISDNWCAHQIAKMPIGKGKSPETIRKNMKG